MRTCDNCGKNLPLGSDVIEVRAIGFGIDMTVFCKPLCFEEYYSERRYKLVEPKDEKKKRNCK